MGKGLAALAGRLGGLPTLRSEPSAPAWLTCFVWPACGRAASVQPVAAQGGAARRCFAGHTPRLLRFVLARNRRLLG